MCLANMHQQLAKQIGCLNAVNYGYEVTEKVLWTQVTSIRVLTCHKSLLKAQRFC